MSQIPISALTNVVNSPVFRTAFQEAGQSTFLKGEIGSITALQGKIDSFENKLREQTEPFGKRERYGMMRYPLEIGQTKEYANIMRITTYDTSMSSLETLRGQGLQTVADAIAQSPSAIDIASSVASGIGAGIEKTKDLVGRLVGEGTANQIFSAGGNFLGGAASPLTNAAASFGRATARISQPTKSDNNDYQREMTGLDVGTEKLKDGDIYLYCPPEVTVSYNNGTTEQDFASLNPYIFPLGNNPDSMKSYAKYLGMSNIKAIGEKLPGLDSNVIQAYAESANRQVINPLSVARFKGTERRQFTFDFVFYPKSAAEMFSCYSIISHLKKYSHPARADDGRFLTYPAEFQIEFLDAETLQPNQYLPVISRCSLTEFTVAYGESVVMATFKPVYPTEGSPPTKIRMSLKFTELEILTRERFEGNQHLMTNGNNFLAH